MTNDLSTRLLASIARAEYDEINNLAYSVAEWSGIADSDDDKLRCTQCGWIKVGDEAELDSKLKDHVLEHPSHALRFCQAHREIVEFHTVCMADHAQIKDRLANSEMRPVVRAEWEQKATEALIRLQISDHYLGVLARAYNLEESA